jgi:hypothetical protein
MNKSIIAFLLLCIPARIAIAIAPNFINDKYIKLYGVLLLLMGLSFVYLFFTNSRLKAPEAGGKTWWAKFRILIGVLHITAAIYALTNNKKLIWIPLAMDIIFGLIIFTIKHYYY